MPEIVEASMKSAAHLSRFRKVGTTNADTTCFRPPVKGVRRKPDVPQAGRINQRVWSLERNQSHSIANVDLQHIATIIEWCTVRCSFSLMQTMKPVHTLCFRMTT